MLALLLSSVFADPALTIVQNAAQIPDLSTLVAVLSLPAYAPIFNALNSPGTYTLFAPNNAAFAAAGIDPSQSDFVSAVLLYHTLGITAFSYQLSPLQFPGSLSTQSPFVLLGGAAQAIDVTRTPAGVFTNWGVPGNLSQTAQVVVADIAASNGVIHIINQVQLLPTDVATTASNAGLTTLLNAVVKAGLATAITTTPGITVFAPTNDAFAKAGIDPDNLTPAQLQPILLYHVVPAVAYSTQLQQGQILPTLNSGSTLKVDLTNGVQILAAQSTANVILPNALVTNGVVHVIDTVLIP